MFLQCLFEKKKEKYEAGKLEKISSKDNETITQRLTPRLLPLSLGERRERGGIMVAQYAKKGRRQKTSKGGRGNAREKERE